MLLTDLIAKAAAEEIGNVARDAGWREATYQACLILALHDVAVGLQRLTDATNRATSLRP